MKKVELLKKLEEWNKNGDMIIYKGFEDLLEEGEKLMIRVTFNDFEGFDDNWSEIMRPLTIDSDMVENFLKENCIECDIDFYSDYEFEDCIVRVGWSSYDI